MKLAVIVTGLREVVLLLLFCLIVTTASIC